MNKVTTGCGSCSYCKNGQCSYGLTCYGIQYDYKDGKITVGPIQINLSNKICESCNGDNKVCIELGICNKRS